MTTHLTKRTLLRSACLALAGVAVVALPVFQLSGTPTPLLFEERLEVRSVDLDVVVRERGVPLRGLTRGDFEVLVDGEPTEIEFFTEIAEGEAVLPVDDTVISEGHPPGTRYLVFIDDVFAIPSHRDVALRALGGQLDALRAEDRMSVVAYGGTGLDQLVGWTRSAIELRGVFEVACGRDAHGLRRMTELRRLNHRRLVGDGSGAFSRIGFSGVQDFAPQRTVLAPSSNFRIQIERVARAAGAALYSSATELGAASGHDRLVMVLLTGGWPGFDKSDSAAEDRSATGRRSALSPLILAAQRFGVPVYPIDLDTFPAERGLRVLASATGGHAFLRGTADRALEQIAGDMASHYRLGFTPGWQEDGSVREVEVRLKRAARSAARGRVELRSRQGFPDAEAGTDLTRWLESVLLFDRLPESEALKVKLGPASRDGRRELRWTAQIEAPSAAGERRLHLVALREDGELVDIDTQTVPAAGGSIEAGWSLRSSAHRMLFALHDPETGDLRLRHLALDPSRMRP